MTTQKLIAKVRSLGELRRLAHDDERYARLALVAASNLGGGINAGADPGVALAESLRWLETNADETDEDGVIAEVNFCRDLI